MALIVEDGTGKSDAESYISVADATTYHAAYNNPASWSGAATADQENALRVSAQYLDAVYGRRWAGYRANEGQALDWPRSGAEDLDGYAIDDDSVPIELERATAILALKVIDGDTLLPDIATPGQISSESAQVGALSTSKTYLGGKGEYKRYSLVEHILAPLIRVGSGVDRG